MKPPPDVTAAADQAHAKLRAALNDLIDNWHTDRATLTKAIEAEGDAPDEMRLTSMLQVALVAGGYTRDPILAAALLACALWKLEVQKYG